MKTLTPAQSLVWLALVGVAISGWLYGIHWKRVASGDLFSKDERLMIRLQDQIRSLTETNANLNEQLKAQADEPTRAAGAAPAPDQAPEPVPLPAEKGPALPERAQKIETH